MDIIQLIEELEGEFSQGKNIFWSKKSLVNLERCAELIEELKQNLPTALQEASYVLSQKEKILSQANEIAEKTIKEAEVKAEQIVGESELIRKSEDEADEIVSSATKKCNHLYAVTKDNIDKMLKAVENYLAENLNIVRANREELNNIVNIMWIYEKSIHFFFFHIR